MICKICTNMLEKHTNYRWKGTYDLKFHHHPNYKSLENSAQEKGCCVCRVLLFKFHSRPDAESQNYTAPGKRTEAFFTQASLTYNRQWSAYRLDIRLNKQYDLELVGSFFLKQILKELGKSFHIETSRKRTKRQRQMCETLPPT